MLAALLLTVVVQPGDTMSGIAASHGVSLSSLEADNPQVADPNLIYAGNKIFIGGHGGVSAVSSSPADHEPDGDSDDPVSSAPSPSPSSTTFTPTPVQSSGGGLSDVPGVPQAFAACVAERESSNGTNQAYNGGVYGIITASGINVNGQSISAQKAAFSKLYGQYGSAPWAPSDGC